MHIPLQAVEELDYFEFLAIRRDAWITHLDATKEGHEYLNNAYRLTVDKPERARLRDQFAKG